MPTLQRLLRRLPPAFGRCVICCAAAVGLTLLNGCPRPASTAVTGGDKANTSAAGSASLDGVALHDCPLPGLALPAGSTVVSSEKQPDGGWRAQAKVPGDWDSILLWLDPALAGSDFTRIKSGPQGDSMAARYECNHNSKFLIVVYRKDREDYNLAMAYAGR